ncbi:MAG: response regulator transcription factor [Acidobacteria bacterium]|nr:response regulator transcription factor [Acidobacteriota bacterium]MBI3426523.1 response regulator transcription factor [Acidobacteriota bacterium]
MTLLIVEDNEAMRRLLRHLLQDLAEAIYECDNGAAASSAYARHQPDWVLMDLKLPGLDGLAATRQLTTQWPGTRVVIVTEFDEPQFRQRAQEAGAVAYVLKDELQALRPLLLRQSC